jgi:hypothetical protein
LKCRYNPGVIPVAETWLFIAEFSIAESPIDEFSMLCPKSMTSLWTQSRPVAEFHVSLPGAVKASPSGDSPRPLLLKAEYEILQELIAKTAA